MRAPLIVGADGRESWVRYQAGIEAGRVIWAVGRGRQLRIEMPHGDAAWEWFRDDGVLAFLPLPGNRISIVWTAFEERSAS